MKHITNFYAVLLKGLSFLHLIFLLGISNGLYGQQLHAFLDDVEVNDIDFEGSKVWVCTQSSVVCIDTISGQKTFYDYSKYDIGHHIKSVKIDELGNKLILDSYGLHILHSNNSWSHFNSINSYLFRLHKD